MSFAKAQDILQLAMMATKQGGVTLEDIAETFGCSHRTAQRMTSALEAVFPQVVSIQGQDRRMRWLMSVRTIAPLLTPSSDELIALSEAVTLLDRAGMKQEAACVRNLECKINALVPPVQRTRLDVDKEAVIEMLGYATRPGPRPAAADDVIEAIYEALKGPNLLRILYQKHREDVPRERIVAPYGLLLGVRRYLVARDVKKGMDAQIRHFRVEELQEARVLDHTFELDPNFDLKKHAERGFGSFVNDAEFGEVVWRFRPEAAEHARRYVFHPNQTTETTEDGSLIVKFKASGHLEMAWHLYSWGESVEVLAPETLRQMVLGYQRVFQALP
ncbi:helix-turn-helix transcriptional regulator [Acetobacter cerevisiae]|uniref:Transcriptional regulator n=1 Tax=Acetobacter cerevisiae TaxID=178900 RepID=A0A149VDA1_9PROT|nr:WYL domain-containing protein [Acetobacter cerevisiae]KXV77903.1 transcriptional regulator [Acetobacter cerevisiae]